MKRYGIIGHPLSHSFSKKYFSEKFRLENHTDCQYDEYPLPIVEGLPELLKQNPGLLGLNVTIPHKQALMPYLTDRSHLPAGLNACNCIKISGDDLIGYNTDTVGFERSLLPLLGPHQNHALVLGNGGAAEAVKYVLQKLNISYGVVGRNKKRGITFTYDQLDEKIIKENTLIINTTPLGTFPEIHTFPDIPYQYLTPDHLLFDLVYNPSKTLFLQKGEERGALIRNGYEMLELQAEASWAIWNED
jgi:shikimate dehydrogenase